jgi:hypothetical protein
VKHRAATDLVICLYPALVGFDDGSRNRQSHSHALGLSGEKWLKHHFRFVGWNARAAIRYSDLSEVIVANGSDADLAFGTRHGRHRVHGIHNKIDDDLLKLNAPVTGQPGLDLLASISVADGAGD